jgi:hypothetical protein
LSGPWCDFERIAQSRLSVSEHFLSRAALSIVYSSCKLAALCQKQKAAASKAAHEYHIVDDATMLFKDTNSM